MNSLRHRLENSFDEIVKLRRVIHQNPELSNQEFRTTDLIKEHLKQWGWEIYYCPELQTGVIASLNKELRNKKNIVLRADIDALPMQEQSDLPFASKTKAAHSCGHDIHTASLLLTAKTLSQLKSELNGMVTLLFQPAEETLDGAKAILNTNFFHDFPPTMIVAHHTWPFLNAGSIGLRLKECMASSATFQIVVKGKGGHGAHPEDCIDPIVAAATLITSLQSIVSRHTAPLDSCVITVGSIHGGTAPNIIPDEVTLKGTIRTCQKHVWDTIQRQMDQITRGIALSTGTTISLELTEGCPALINTPSIVREIEISAKKILGNEQVHNLPQPSMGSEDFAFYLQHMPGALFRIGTANAQPSTQLGLHNAKIMFDEKAILTGASVLCQFVCDQLA